MKALASPLVAAVLASLLSAAAVLGWFWKTTTAYAAALGASRVAEHEASRPEKPWDFWTTEIEELAAELATTRAKLDEREAGLAAREKRLAEEASELERTRAEIERLRGDIDTRLIQIGETEAKNLKPLAATYSQLTPTAAVAIFAQLDDLTVAKLLSLMKTEVNSAILEELAKTPGPDDANAKRAARLSLHLKRIAAEKKSS